MQKRKEIIINLLVGYCLTVTLQCVILFIFQRKRKKCFRCGKDTRVIGFGIESYVGLEDIEEDEYKDYIADLAEEINNDEIHITGSISPILNKFRDI